MPVTVFFGQEKNAKIIVTLEDGAVVKLDGVVSVDVIEEGDRRRTTVAPVLPKKTRKTYSPTTPTTDDDARAVLDG